MPKRLLLILAIAAMTVLFFVGGPNYHSARSVKAFWNLGHIVYFAVFPLLLTPFTVFQKRRHCVQIGLILLLTVCLAALVEWLQYGLDRTPDSGDMFRNLIGAGIAISFYLPAARAMPIFVRRIAMFVFTGLALTQLVPVGIAALDEHAARQSFPIISDFQSPGQIRRWSGSAVITRAPNIGNRGNWAMQVHLTTWQYSGCALNHFPGDWQGYQWFQFRVYNPADRPIAITCRIHDQIHTQGIQRYDDRFNGTYRIASGWNTIRISLANLQQAPATRRMNLRRIYGVGIFASHLPHPQIIYIDDVQLK